MNNHLVFATSAADAIRVCGELQIVFDDTVWVMNLQLLGSVDFSDHQVHYSEAFTSTPAYAEASAQLPGDVI